MRKIVLSFISLSFLLSCNRESNNDLTKVEPTKNDVSFIGYSKIIKSYPKLKQQPFGTSSKNDLRVDGVNVGFEFELGRKSRNCHGFGLCELSAFWIDIYSDKGDKIISKENKSTGVITKTSNIVFEDNGNEYGAFLFLANNVDDEKFDMTLVIDEDIRVNNQYIVKKGSYHLDERLGDFGGYQLGVEKL